MSDHSQPTDKTRRQFLGSASLTALAAAIPGLTLVNEAQAHSAHGPVTDKVRWGMFVDTSKCGDGCDKCVTACNEENGISSNDRPLSDAQWIREIRLRDKLTGDETTLPMLCQHCEHPPCVDVCPTGASFRRADGIVLVDKHICIGCRYCMMACPYKARSFIHETVTDQKPHAPRGKGTVESCTFCVHRVDEGGTPACVEACQKDGGGAMIFGDLKDPNSDLYKALTEYNTVQIRADLDLNTGVRYHGI